jgi:hypothetical protein
VGYALDEPEVVDQDVYVEEIDRPAGGSWLVAVAILLLVGVSFWFWNSTVNDSAVTPVAAQPHVPPHSARYVILREGETSRVVGGTEVASEHPTARAESLSSFTTTNPNQFTGTKADLTRIGQTVTIDGAAVRNVNGSKAISLDAGKGSSLLVYFPEPVQGDIRVVRGDTVDVIGTLQRMPSQEAAQSLFELSDSESAKLTTGKLYLNAYRIAIR